MSGFPAFQANAFQNDAFQTGVMLVAADFSLGSPAFATPTIKINYQFLAPAYSLGSPSFATPTLATAFIVLTVNGYSLGSPTFSSPFLRSTQRLTAPNYAVGSPAFGAPALAQLHNLAVNGWSIGSPDFGSAKLQKNYQLVAADFSLAPPTYSPSAVVRINYVLLANAYWLDRPRFGFPRLTVTKGPTVVWPLTYLNAVEEASTMLRTMLDTLLSSIPSRPITKQRNQVRRLISILRGNAEDAVRGETLGTQLAEIFLAADAAGATFTGVDNVRLYLMTQSASRSIYTQIIFRSALVMVLALESRIIVRTTFKTQDQVTNTIVYMRDAFDAARNVSVDEVDALVYQTITTMAGALINHLSIRELQLPRTLIYNIQMPMPSLYLANRIYQDATRADELETENDVVHPLFMPRKLKVLSNAGIPLGETFLRPRPPVT